MTLFSAPHPLRPCCKRRGLLSLLAAAGFTPLLSWAAAPELLPTAVPAAEVPLYRTRLPPPLTLEYTLRKGGWSGTGELHWRPEGARYEARLEGRVAGFKVLTWASEGGFDTAGLAPARFTDERRGKPLRAATFQRQSGKITFTGDAAEVPLAPGAQDRLSWMVQMGAIASAEPRRVASGQRVSLYVSGARGDADVWSFQSLGADEVMAGGARIQAVKLLREPRKARDTRVEVWLDPKQHYLPIRARLSSDGETLELLLRGMHPPV